VKGSYLLRDRSGDFMIMLKKDLKETYVRIWIEFILIRVRPGSRLFSTRL
jgi:hypothetical protein